MMYNLELSLSDLRVSFGSQLCIPSMEWKIAYMLVEVDGLEIMEWHSCKESSKIAHVMTEREGHRKQKVPMLMAHLTVGQLLSEQRGPPCNFGGYCYKSTKHIL